MNSKTVATNKKARFDFFLEETFVAGLMLEGWEVKSLRECKLNIHPQVRAQNQKESPFL